MTSPNVNSKYKEFREAVLTSQARQIIDGHSTANNIVQFLHLSLQRMPQDEAVEVLLERALSRRSGRIYFVNAHTVVTSKQQPALDHALTRADMLLPDGSGVLWSSRLFGQPITYNLNGTDLIPAVCKAGASKGLSVFLLGAKPGVAEDAARNLKRTNPELTIAGTQHGFYKPEDLPNVLEKIRQAKPHILLVAMGVPLQEIWIDQNAHDLPGITCIGVGGLFDFLAERVVRAPYAVRYLGMEWFWRMMMEPKRLWHRYTVGNVVFLRLVFQYFWTAMTQPSSALSGNGPLKSN